MLPHSFLREEKAATTTSHGALFAAAVRETDLGGLLALAPAWTELAHEIGAPPFLRPEWSAAFLSAFSRGEPLVAAAVYHGRQLRAILPLLKDSHFFRRLPARVLRSPSNFHSCRFDLIESRHDRAAINDLLWRALRSRSDWDVIELWDVPDGGSFEAIMERAADDGFLAGKWPTFRSPYLEIPPPGVDLANVFPPREKSFRHRLKSKVKKLSGRGDLKLERVTDPRSRRLREFFELEAAGWKGSMGTAIGSDARLVSFYENVAASFAKLGEFTLYSLTLGNRPLAMQFGLTSGRTYYMPKVAYDENEHRCSPGQILVLEVLEDLQRRGVQRYEFLGSASRWKNVWTASDTQHAHCYIFRPNLRGRLLYSAVLKAAPALRRAKRWIEGEDEE